jgi:hypothetical protein
MVDPLFKTEAGRAALVNVEIYYIHVVGQGDRACVAMGSASSPLLLALESAD